ncbi:UTRA domain-containing protein [Streptomyces sp. NPDC048304]|uniref:GntR family transcriptional regulator n=1 Tax=Streptomyces sp. NPDC048304 TaxID=3154820 RepID=UPI0033C614EB
MTDERWTGASTPYIESGQGDVWGKEAAGQGRTGTQRILKAEEVAPPQDIASALDLPSGEAAVMRQRLILLDGCPIELANSYWPAAIAAGTPLASTGKIRGGTVSLLAELGYRPGTVAEDVHTRPPTREEAEALQLTDNREWVLVLTRTISTADGQPYEVSVMVSPGRIGRLHYSMKVD